MIVWRNALGLLALPVALALALPAALAAGPFLLVSGAVRWMARRLDREAAEWHELIRFEPDLGWMPVAHVDAWHRDLGGDVYRLRTDAEGWRGAETSRMEADILVLGDSFAFGNAIGERAFFGNVASGPAIKAIGAPGYDMVQELMLLRRYRESLHGKLVAWLIYPGNDLEDNLRPHMDRYRCPLVREAGDGWEIVTAHVSREEWAFPSRRPNFETYVDICSPGSLVSRRAFGACEWLLARGKELCEEAGASLAVVTIPDLSEMVRSQIAGVLEEDARAAERFQPDFADRRIAEICSGLDLPFVPLADHLSPDDYRRRDVHWNERGNRRVARVLERLYERTARPERVPSSPPASGRPAVGGKAGVSSP